MKKRLKTNDNVNEDWVKVAVIDCFLLSFRIQARRLSGFVGEPFVSVVKRRPNFERSVLFQILTTFR